VAKVYFEAHNPITDRKALRNRNTILRQRAGNCDTVDWNLKKST
jgi:hypothetical protein